MTFSSHFPDLDKKLIRSVMTIPLLSQEEETRLAKQWKNDKNRKALDKLTRAYLRITVSMATRFRHYGLSVTDLIQEGTVGLMEAANRFDPDREVRFSTYANWWVRASMQDYVLRNWSIVRTGTTAAHKALFFGLKRTRLKLKITNSGPLSLNERERIAVDMKVKVRDVEAMEARLYGADQSLSKPVGEETATCWQDLLESPGQIPEEIVMHKNDTYVKNRILEKALSRLSSRESYIIRQRQLNDESRTLSCLGKDLGISKERVRQVEAIAMGKLKRSILTDVGEPTKAGLLN